MDDRPHDVFFGILHTAAVFSRSLEGTLGAFRLTLRQYHVLQTLRHSAGQGMTCGEVARGLVTRDSDITRLLDRLELLGFVARSRQRPDRRVVRTRITAQGTAVLSAVDESISEIHAPILGHLSSRRLKWCRALLKRATAGDVKASSIPHPSGGY